jgi:hypothetical protein
MIKTSKDKKTLMINSSKSLTQFRAYLGYGILIFILNSFLNTSTYALPSKNLFKDSTTEIISHVIGSKKTSDLRLTNQVVRENEIKPALISVTAFIVNATCTPTNTGSIDIDEASRVVLRLNSRLGRSYGEDEVKAFFAALDTTQTKTLSLDEFKKAASNYLEEKETSMVDYYSKYYSEIISKKYLFNRNKIILQQLPNITKNSLITFVREYILENPNICLFKLNGNE